MVSLQTPICDFGWKAVDFDLEGVDGRRYSLADVRGSHGTLVIFMCNHCPYVKAVIDRIIRDVRALKPHGIGAIAIMVNDAEEYPADSFDNMRRWAQEREFPFPYVIDPTQRIGREYNAVCTPDFFGFNADLALQYRGRLDESRKEPAAPDARRELYEAMVQIAETGRGPAEQIPSMGCSIKWRDEDAPAAAAQ
ncbi:MAG: thioredoxin family protein [Proteobacteria bacterium]|nr:thioredoxin family protein [Pseudomonadota bacterium]